ncbi:MAG: DNA polymerase IV [Promethearchaeota archaeon]
MAKNRAHSSYQPLKRYLDLVQNEESQPQESTTPVSSANSKTSSKTPTNIQVLALEPWVMHVDMDAFFASVEIRSRPELQGLPVCVGPNPKHGTGRGVVRSASYEARTYGIHSAMPVSQAYRLCPDAVFVSSDFSNYTQASEEIMSILAEYADGGRVRRASIDEAYIETTFKVQEYEHPKDLAREIQKVIDERTQLSCSIGIAPNMSVAKIAANVNKPRGVTFVPQDPVAITEFLAPLNVKVLNGVGRVTAAKLQKHGIKTLGQIQKMTLAELYPIMGKHSHWLYERAKGIDKRPIKNTEPRVRKSISKDRTFFNDIDPQATEIINPTLEKMCNQITQKFKAKNLHYRTVTIKLRYDDYTTIQRSKTLSVATGDSKLILKIVIGLFRNNLDSKRKIRLLGVKISGLSKEPAQRTLNDFCSEL